VTGDEDDRCIGKGRVRLEPFAHLEPAQAGHLRVEQNHIGRRLAHQPQRVLPIGGELDLAQGREDSAQHLDSVGVVVDQQDGVTHAVHPLGGRECDLTRVA
jgi:hypothetical protein